MVKLETKKGNVVEKYVSGKTYFEIQKKVSKEKTLLKRSWKNKKIKKI